MNFFKKLLFLVSILGFFSISIISNAQNDLQENLSDVYKAFLEASCSGDSEAVKENMSSYSYINARNQAISAKRQFDGELFKKMSKFMPNVDDLKFIKLVHKGDTAVLIYGKNMDSKTEKEIIVIRFINEHRNWKFDSVTSHYGEKDLSNSTIITEYEIDGKVKKAPPVYPVPDHVGIINVTSYGYRTVVIINDIEQRDVLDESSAGLIMGGLKKGENKIELKITKIDKDTMFKPEITVLKSPGTGQKGQEVYKFEPQGEIKGSYIETIVIED